MAPTTTNEFEGDDFSNNLFSDLAPLLTLSGEQVTKKFHSMSMGWAGNALLAMGPLGIITTIVSAIRVGGGKNLKALIGRFGSKFSVFLGLCLIFKEHGYPCFCVGTACLMISIMACGHIIEGVTAESTWSITK